MIDLQKHLNRVIMPVWNLVIISNIVQQLIPVQVSKKDCDIYVELNVSRQFTQRINFQSSLRLILRASLSAEGIVWL